MMARDGSWKRTVWIGETPKGTIEQWRLCSAWKKRVHTHPVGGLVIGSSSGQSALVFEPIRQCSLPHFLAEQRVDGPG